MNNNIYLLKPLPSVRKRNPPVRTHNEEKQNTPDHPEHNPWSPWYDKAFGFVVSAPTVLTARRLASAEAGDEKFVQYDEEGNTVREHNPWLDPAYTSCEVIGTCDLEAMEVIMRDFASA